MNAKPTWEKKRIEEGKILDYLKAKYPTAKEIRLTKYKKLSQYKPLLQKDYGMDNDCSLTAITTILSKDMNKTPEEVYSVVEKYAKQYGFRGKGTLPFFIKSIFDKTLKDFKIFKSTKQGYVKVVGYDYDRICSIIDENTPIVLSINKDGRNYYNNHSIVIVGYSIYKVDGVITPMLLVYDNWKACTSVVDYKALSMISSINYMG